MNDAKTNTNSFSWKFFGLTFLLTWALWFPAGLDALEQFGILTKILHSAGGVLPTLVALCLLYRYNDSNEQKNYWRRLIDLRGVNKFWYVVIFLTVPMLTITGVIFDIILGGKGVEMEGTMNFVQNPLALIPFSVFILVFGPLPEELAWRGYALDRLQSRWNALEASLILGVSWTIWHLPLFFINGRYQHGLGIVTTQFWLYMLDKIPISIVMTWIYNNNRQSTATAVIFHFMVNFIGELIDLSLQAETIYSAFWWIMALLVITIWKPQRLVLIKSRT